METPNYYAIIPANVRYAKIKPNAKLLYGEITALASKTGECYASNAYFAKLYDVSDKQITVWIAELLLHGFIESRVDASQGNKRYISIVPSPTHQKVPTYPPKGGEGTHQKVDTPTHQKVGYNNTRNNNTVNRESTSLDATNARAEKEKELFGPLEDMEKRERIVLYFFDRNKLPPETINTEIEKFLAHWREPALRLGKVRWQGEKYFDTKKRLVTWMDRVNPRSTPTISLTL